MLSSGRSSVAVRAQSWAVCLGGWPVRQQPQTGIATGVIVTITITGTAGMTTIEVIVPIITVTGVGSVTRETVVVEAPYPLGGGADGMTVNR